ncbi:MULTISPECIES: hypothetical protein [unclassified Rhizobium]|uniref:hypothetical protein n=1 Tax=unclassified Rhizobium TaxID=2613769 RepID=UPI00247AD3B0|nr:MULTISPECIES: hypothetical protein [unclassified Rhizobium]MDH7802255.1 hypothetical protein [Rhizobium sp. AN70]
MSAAITSILIAAATKVGAPIIKSVLEKHVGGLAGTLAGTVVDQVAERLGVEPEALPTVDEKELDNAVRDVDFAMPEVIALYQQGLQGQFALLQAEQAEGFWQSAWRWGWMYLLAFLWICAFLLFPVLRVFGIHIEPIDSATLMTLTGWFISLYMGGHTLKEFGKQAVEAVKTWKRTP